MAERSITCFDCDTPADGPADILYRDGFTCRNCGAKFKVLNVQGIPIRIRITVTVIRHQGHRKTSRQPKQKPQRSTSQSPPRTYRVQVSDLEDNPTGACAVEVSRADGTPITTGAGPNQLEALHGIVPYMLPKDHPQYPEALPTPDDE
jgi:hypothetical protein